MAESRRYRTETDLEEALRFYEATEVDLLAVSIGTSHGKYKDAPDAEHRFARTNFQTHFGSTRTARIFLHAGGNDPRGDRNGIAKNDVDTELRDAVISTDDRTLWKGEAFEFVNELTWGGYAEMTRKVREKMQLFGSSGKADGE